MKQTAIDWLVKHLQIGEWMPEDSPLMDWLIYEAKEMEKQQIVDAWEDGKHSFSSRNAKQYYNETYGTQD